MIKSNVFEATKQLKRNTETLLTKIRNFNTDIDKHIGAANARKTEIEQAAIIEAQKRFNESTALEAEKVPSPANINESSIQLSSKIDDNIAFSDLSFTDLDDAKTSKKLDSQADSEIKKKDLSESVSKEPSLTEVENVKESLVKKVPQFTVDKKVEESTSALGKQNDVRSASPISTKTPSETVASRPPQRDATFAKPQFPKQGLAQKSEAAKPYSRTKSDRKPTDIVDKFFADPELKEREKKEKEEFGRPPVAKTMQTQSKSKNRQDKKELWHEKDKVAISPFNKNKNFKNKKNDLASKQEIVSPTAERKKSITMGEFISVKDLSEKIGVQASAIIKSLLNLGVLVTINQELDYDTAMLVSSEFKIDLEKKSTKTFEQIVSDDDVIDSDEFLSARPPIVTVMGHVDHGKTSLLDAIRNSKVTFGEAGGITQHIGAYTVDMNKRQITFLDTPGHEAFTSMRARGAQVTDIAILVVAANDGIKPQTIEALNHAKAANVPIIVAINKIDLPDADPDRAAQQLMEYGLVAEKWGGDTIVVPVSATKRIGIDTLLEMITLVAELQELKANPNRLAKGTVIEAQLDKGRGPVATVLVQNGTLNVGDAIVAGKSYGRVRAMMDFKGNRIKKAGPSMPVEVLGLSDVPEAGDVILAVKDDKLAKQVADEREAKSRDQQQKTLYKTSLEDLLSGVKSEEIKDLNIIVKADVQGSIEAVKNALERIPSDKVRIKTIHGGVGAITEGDVMLATASNAIIVGFNVRPSGNAADLAQKEKIDIRLYRIIYNAIEDIQAAIKGMLAPVFKENIIGQAEIRAVFKVTGMGNVAGCFVTSGKISRNAGVRLIRDGIVVHEGTISSLKRFKDDAKDVASGYECGISINNFNDVKVQDIIEAFIMEEVENK